MKYSNVLYGILGFLLAAVFVYFGIRVGSYIGDRIAEMRGVSYEGYTAGITVTLFTIFLLPAGYLIYKNLISNSILGKFFLWTVVVLGGLYTLFLLIYLSL
ncbi:MAG: hypothetical protein G01um101429_1122 [Parcubacteria group bacterium Gr01-1014_29]|nr:MAG: hypothetical protein G01um101429_1122 [Parcubacteria group bacterium Gr01-1014_29]